MLVAAWKVSILSFRPKGEIFSKILKISQSLRFFEMTIYLRKQVLVF